MGIGRRQLLGGAAIAAAGVAAGAAVTRNWPILGPDRLPIYGGSAPAGVARGWSARGGVGVHWHVPTDQPLVALTFDDGPGPRWTPMVLDALAAVDAPATFFLVGERLTRHPELLRGRLRRHEVGNHTWAHRDLAQLDQAGVTDQLTRAHDAIRRFTGRTPTLMRPPWGHLGGSTLVVADQLGYDVVLWSQQMRERQFRSDPPGQVRDIVDNARPGSIVLAHDVGAAERLVALRQLGAIVRGLRSRGLRLVTVPDLLAAARSAPDGERAPTAGSASVPDRAASAGRAPADRPSSAAPSAASTDPSTH